ncbi:MAG: NAD(P)/FAD-dependent oxidoreductase [Myxococcota bacterium]
MQSSRRAVIIGAGISGILTARRLLLEGWDVTVLEAEHVGAGSSSRTAAGIRQQFSTLGTVRGMRFAVQFYERFAREVEGGEPVIAQNGYLFLYDDQQRYAVAKDLVALQRQAGLREVEVLDAGDLRARFPQADGETLVGGTWCPTDGFLRPALVYNEGARRVRELGGVIRQRSPVRSAEVVNGRVVALVTPQGRVEGDVFFDCTNAWTNQLSAVLGTTPIPMTPLRRYLWIVARGESVSAEEFAAWPMIISPSGAYGRPENADSLLMGWSHHDEVHEGFSREDQDEVPPQYSHQGGFEARPYLAWEQMCEACSVIGEFDGVTASTAGYYATTPDHNPYLGFDPNLSNVIRLVGFSGHGAMFGPFTAEVGMHLAEAGTDVAQVTLDTGEVPLAEFAFGRDTSRHEALVI